MIPDSVLSSWDLRGPGTSLGEGRINDTYRVDQKYVIQKINKNVFHCPREVIGNYRAVYDTVFDLVPRMVPTDAGRDFFEDEQGDVWRAFVYHDSESNPSFSSEYCQAAAEAYGSLLSRLQECTVALNSVIEGFHDIHHYVKRWREADNGSEQGDGTEFRPEIQKILRSSESSPRLSLGRHIIHGDCKMSNLLFRHNSPQVLRIVDLDTLMMGHPRIDFGDLVRSVIGKSVFDSESSSVSKTKLLSLCKGFFSRYRVRSSEDLELFVSAPAHMSGMLGIRYLTDHLEGDRYFKVKVRGENMQRAKRQFALKERLVNLEGFLRESIEQTLEQSVTAS